MNVWKLLHQIQLLLLVIHWGSGQDDGETLRPLDVAQFKKIHSKPDDITCGDPSPTLYCKAVDSEDGLLGGACDVETCDQKCPERDRELDQKPRSIDLLDVDPGACVTIAEGRRRGTQSYRFYNERLCGLSPGIVPRLGDNRDFTLSVWLNQGSTNVGTIFDKVAGPGSRKYEIITILVGARSILMQYLGIDARLHLQTLPTPIPPNKWCHLAIQVYQNQITVYVDEIGENLDDNTEKGTPLYTAQLAFPILDINDEAIVKMGHRIREWNMTSSVTESILQEFPQVANSTAQYVGRMQDFHWYDQALTNREIQELVTGKFRDLNIQSNCLCPSGFPRVSPVQERFCIRNGDFGTNATLKKRRLNENANPLGYILDGDDTTKWISRQELYMPGGLTLVVDLANGEYEVFYVVIKFYNSQPKSIAISRNSSATNGEIQSWGSFADDCDVRFRMPNNKPLTQPDSANCQIFDPVIPYSNSTVTFNLMPTNRPGYSDFYGTPKLMDFVKASKIHIRFTYQYFTATEGFDLKHIYYGVRSVQVIGRCNCHGHAVKCDTDKNPYQCQCSEESHSDGNMCERCQPLYNNKAFRIGNTVSPNNCRKCECNNHAESCHYERERDPHPDDFYQGGGGVCDDCGDNTMGLNCERCRPRFYRKPEKALDDEQVCSPCRCRRAGVANQTMECEEIGGQCPCKSKVTSRRCDVCVAGYYNLNLENEEGCDNCRCFLDGTRNRSIICSAEVGQCHCKTNVRGRTCSDCEYGFKNLTDDNPYGCEACGCNVVGSTSQFCNARTGQCPCRDHVQGSLCDECSDGFWGVSDSGCRPCDCDAAGSEPETICDKQTGQCVCKANTQGRVCQECKDRYYNLEQSNVQGCEYCSCDSRGAVNGSLVCDKVRGECDCKSNVGGRVCNQCRGNTFGLRHGLEEGCEPCNCDPMGTALGQELQPHELVCDSNSGQCACLPSREGRRCKDCSPGYYLPLRNETGCLVCDCHPVGSSSQVCNNVTGMCPCKSDESGEGLSGRRCDRCARSFWNFHDLFGTCEPCGCDVAGSESNECNEITGQCECKGNVEGRQCGGCKPGSSQLRASNPMGCYSHPKQQAAPTDSSVGSRYITLSWNPPDYPNGDVLTYQLYRNKEVIYNLTDSSPFVSYTYNDTSLLPYTNYDYHIETTNVGGSVLSPTLRVRTLAGIPTGVPPMIASNVRAHQANFEWGEPAVAHGPIETYVLQSVNTEVDDTIEVHYRGLSTRALIHSLSAFTNYTFTLRACTSGGCGDSLPVVVLTPEANPTKQNPPTVTALSNTSLLVTWNPPIEANGIIREYELMMRGKPGQDRVHRPLQRRVFQSFGAYNPRPVSTPVLSSLNPPQSNYTQGDLQPYTEYEFLVSASNRLGSVESPWATARTLEGTPVFMPPPVLDPVSSFEVNITWGIPDPVSEVRGQVVMYQVILTRNNTSGNRFAPPTEDVVIYSTGPKNRHFLATGFDPYSSHKISMNLCNSISCIRSEARNVTTLPAAPELQSPPTAMRNNSILNLTWKDPRHVNGPRPAFMLMKSRVAFSEPPIEMTRGVRFPGLSYVRFPPSIIPRDASYTGIELRFRTFEPDCLLFFSAAPLSSDGIREEYVVLQLRNGRPWFLFDAQDNPTAVTVDNDEGRRYNDGGWHRIEANRFNRDGFLELDGVFTGSNTSARSTTVIGVNDGVYIGGIPQDYDVRRPGDRDELVVTRKPLIGCVKGVRVQRHSELSHWSNVTWDEADQWYRAYPSWQGCPMNLDRPSVHFLGRGRLKMSEEFRLPDPNTWSVTLSLRTQFTSGLLFYAGNEGNGFILTTILNSRIRFLISSSSGQMAEVIASSNTSSNDYQLCDGNWHDVTLRININKLFIEVDDVIYGGVDIPPASPGYERFYVGGMPVDVMSDMITVLDDDAQPFGGCLRGFQVNDLKVDLSHDITTAYNVDLDGCPLGASNSLPSTSSSVEMSGEGSGGVEGIFPPTPVHPITNSSCHTNDIKILYRGLEHSYFDSEINGSFTRYLYKVSSSNLGGEAQSDWMITRSGEGIPLIVPAPFNERSMSGREVFFEWRRPANAQGVIVNYTLSAEHLHFGDDANQTNANATLDSNSMRNSTFMGDILSGSVTGLLPWSTYAVELKVCTLAGCATSAGKTEVLTLQEIPEDVKTPRADVNATSMTIHWSSPGAGNGPNLRYILYHNSTVVYNGPDTRHHIPGLAIFTPQIFRLEACTVIGCNSSQEVTLFSGQLPPGHVDQPMVTVRGPHTVEVRWLEPAIMNGVFTRYVVYLRVNEAEPPGRVLHNTTERWLMHTIDDLIAGTDYHVTMSACTEGGCTMSSSTPFQTKESVPEDIPAPNVTSPNPISFVVTWRAPRLPNGVVTQYKLHQDEAVVHNATQPSSVTIEDLKPWSKHEFRVEACTKRGCSFSPGVMHRTQQSPPQGTVQLSVTVLGPRALEARWGEPRRKNGRMSYSVICSGIFYESPDVEDYRIRRDSRAMLNSSSALEWMRVEGLIPYTEYIVKVNASNGAGYVISNMRTVKMPPGSPDGVTMPTVTSHDPHSILATWKDPARNNANGNSLFQLLYRAVLPAGTEKEAFSSATRQMSYTLLDLKPYKEYEFQLIASNEYGATYSGWVATKTMQAKPSALDPPIIYEVDAWSLLVTWEAPSSPNGVVERYNLYQNEQLTTSLPGNVTRFQADFLTPFTSYGYKIEACTSAGCTASNDSRRIRTSASAPEGLDPPLLRSDTPASVFVTWKPPRLSNGILDNYRLERKSNESAGEGGRQPKLLGVFVPSQSLRYLDEDVELTPYTTYQYRVICATLGGGLTTSAWENITTRPGRPGGVLSPVVIVTGSESVYVTWKSPLYPNGPITSLELAFPEPRVQISDLSLRSNNVTGLTPYTDYQVKIIACTTGGCTESPLTHALTFPDVPRGLASPIATPISERTINVQWSAPGFQNGPDLHYELSRTILAQPLLPSPSPYINVSQTIYTGTDLVFRDQSLEKFTTCEYRVSAFNSEGSLTSNGTVVTSLAGYPTSTGEMNVAVHNHTAVYVWWEPLSMRELQGEVHRYVIRYNSSRGHVGEVGYSPNVTSGRINGLHPGTTYEFQLSTDNGAHIVTSLPVLASTDDGAPHGVSPPVVYPLSPSQLRVSWLPPLQPNGQITAYNVIIDDVTIHTNLSDASAYVIDKLRPYTIYTIKLEVCTVYACAVSNETKATTQETNPTGIKKPSLEVSGGNHVEVEWEEPVMQNGIIRRYYVQRRMIIQCNDKKPNPERDACHYVKCPLGERVCGGVCYKPTLQVCCKEVLHLVDERKECCESNYVTARGLPSDVCCGGRLHSYAENHQCCHGKYLKVGAQEVCCKDPVEDRVVVGFGDTCCRGIPYRDDRFQVCCDGFLHDGYNRQCCGGKLINEQQTCCGNADKGSVYDVTPTKSCCGSQYLPANSTLCCYSNGEHKAYDYGNMTSSNVQCCVTELITSDESCCNGVGYDPFMGVCADVPTTYVDDPSLPRSCGSGTVCPLERSMYAACDRCDVDRTKFNCIRSSTIPHTSSNDDVCTSPFIIVYSGPPSVLSFFDASLGHHTTYQYKVVAENKVGAGESAISDIKTAQAAPDDVYTPDWMSQDRNTITLSWKPPGRLNGILERYALMRDGLEIWSGLALRHTDRNQVLPYREYKYALKVCTRAGCSSSGPVLATSIQGIPESISPPRLLVNGSTSIQIRWIPPQRSNGVVQRYLINETKLGTIHTVTSPMTSPQDLEYVHSQLDSYTSYTYTVTACTTIGCTSSEEVSAQTKEASPEGIWYRSALLPLNSTSVELIWTEPKQANGVIQEYRVMRRIIGDHFNGHLDEELIHNLPWNLVFEASDDVFTHVDHLQGPGRTVQYQLIAINGAGYGVSKVKQVQLPLEAPIETPLVSAQALGATSVQVDWSFGEEGDFEMIDRFRYDVILQKDEGRRVFGSTTTVSTSSRGKRSTDPVVDNDDDDDDDDQLVTFIDAGSNQSIAIDNLKPFTRYQVRVRTCDTNSTETNATHLCNVGSADRVQTYSAPPEGFANPVVKATGPTSVTITWKPPSDANGVIVGYRVYRRLVQPRDGMENYEERIFFTTDSAARTFTDTDPQLRAFTRHEYQVHVSNSEGAISSEWVEVTTQQDIPSGIKAPILEAVSAFAVNAKWRDPSSPNGIITRYRLEYQRITIDPTVRPPIVTAISTASTILEATFSGLRPYKKYRVRLTAVNQAMLEGKSEWVQVMTLPAPPSEVGNLSATPTVDGRSLVLTWGEPTLPNGEVDVYKLYEVEYEETPIYSGLPRRYHFRRLTPYTEYELVLEACTGPELCARSHPKIFRTAETAPEAQSPPQVTFTNATAIVLSWSKPLRANGRVISYHVIRSMTPKASQVYRYNHKRSLEDRGQSTENHKEPSSIKRGQSKYLDRDQDSVIPRKRDRRTVQNGDFTNDDSIIYEVMDPDYESYNYSDIDLDPFTRYGYRIRTSTKIGFVESDWVHAETHQGLPEGLQPPTVEYPQDKDTTSLIVTWQLPERINGELQAFRLERNDSTPLSLPVNQFRYVNRNLQPYTVYSFRITACTARGCTTSDVTSKRTYEEAPLFVAPPRVAPVNSSAIDVAWEIPEIANGVIKDYRVRVGEVLRYEGLETSALVVGLEPYKSYEVTVEACTNSGCRRSSAAEVRTLEAPPSDMEKPELHVTSSNSIEVIWRLPRLPNGAIIRYEVYRNDELVFVNDGGGTRFHDFSLNAGTTYGYVVVAYNNVGSVRNELPAEAVTDPAAPAGLDPPTLTVSSSSSILTEWQAPAKPNGIIVNYTLFVRQEKDADRKHYDFTGPVFTFHVRGLEFYEEYSFWMRACTPLGCVMSQRVLGKTMEAPPANQMPPRVSSSFQTKMILSVSWYPPLDPNGVIQNYILRRRRILSTAVASETLEAKTIANLTRQTYADVGVLPYTQYQYQVVAVNGAGGAPSPWSTPVRSGEAAPEGVPPPKFYDIRSRSVHVASGNPAIANGIVRFHHVFMSRDNSSTSLEKVSTNVLKEQNISNLLPSTTYMVMIRMCTLDNLCTRGPPAYFTTLEAPPRGQGPPQLISIDAMNATLSWAPPQELNGEIRRYQLYVREVCPSSPQPFPQECAIGEAQLAYLGGNLVGHVTGLTPYTRYAFRVTSFNDHGRSDSEWESAVTLKSDPTYSAVFSAQRNISAIELRWGSSFILNSVLVRYELADRGEIVYVGLLPYFQLRRTSAQGVLVPKNDQSLTNGPDVSPSQIPFYQSLWFILLLALAAMVVVIAALAVTIHKLGRRNTCNSTRMDSLTAPKHRNADPGGAVTGMVPLGPYGSDGGFPDYGVQSAVKTHDIIQDGGGHFNESYCPGSIDRRHLYFDQSHLTGMNDVVYGEQWEEDGRRIFEEEDQDEKNNGYDSESADDGLIANYDVVDDAITYPDVPPIEFVDTHI